MHVATTLNPNNPAWICPQAVVLAVRVSEAMAVRYGPASRWVTHSRIQASLIREEAGDKVRPGPSPLRLPPWLEQQCSLVHLGNIPPQGGCLLSIAYQ